MDGTWYFVAQVKGTVTGAGNPAGPDTVTFTIDAFFPQTYTLGASGKADTSVSPLTLDAGTTHTIKVTYAPATPATSIFQPGTSTLVFTVP